MRTFVLLGALWACRRQAHGDGAPCPDDTAPPTPDKTWIGVNAFGPCALADDGLVTCWSAGAWVDIDEDQLPLDHPPSGARVASVTGDDPIWGVRVDDQRPAVLHNGEGTSEYSVPDRADLRDISGFCARYGAEILCWHAFVSPFPPDHEYVSLGGAFYHHAAVSADGGVWSSAFDTILGAWQLPEGARPIDVAPAEGGACVLLEGGELTCFGPAEGWFDDPPYARVEGARNSVCAQHALTHEVICRDGSVFDWGPLRDLAVIDLPSYAIVFAGTPDERWDSVDHEVGDPPHVCAVTETNAVRCSGWKYDFPDLQAALPAGDE